MADEYKPAQAGSKQQQTVGGAINESLATLDRAKNIIWNQIQVLTAPFTAFSEVDERSPAAGLRMPGHRRDCPR